MKITQTNDSELAIHTSGIGSLITGGILIVAGLAVIVAPFVTTADWWVSLIGLGVGALGTVLVFTATTTTTVLRRQGTSTITEKRLVGGSSKEASFESSQVNSIKLDSHTEYTSSSNTQSGERRRERVSVVYAALKDGTEITLAKKRSNGDGGVSINGIGLRAISKAPLANEAKQIADFLGVQLNTGVQDVSLQGIVGAVQDAFAKPNATPPTVATPAATPVVSPSVAPIESPKKQA